MEEIKMRYLLKVEASANNNKYYKMIPHGDSWTAEYGRVGSRPQKREYPLSQFEKKYREKIQKGYTDQTELHSGGTEQDGPKYKEIAQPSIAEVVRRLQEMARKAVSENYNISSSSVTAKMIDEAQDLLTGLVGSGSVEEFNERLVHLFSVIPRKMSNVSAFLAHSESDFSDIIQKEQDLLDVMKNQAQEAEKNRKKKPASRMQETVLESLGLEMEECTADEISMIRKKLGRCSGKFKNAWKVKNRETCRKFDAYIEESGVKDTRLLWHGSRNENWWSILNTGLVLKPTNSVITGKMFGYGIYYATKAAKSIGYTSLSGSRWAGGSFGTAFMALMEVAYGKPYDVYSFDSKYYKYNYEALQKACPGANCLHAHAGKMLKEDEIIIYKESQCTIRYLVELQK